jgi:hypothetical protein
MTRIFDSVVAKLLTCCTVALATTLVVGSASAQVTDLPRLPAAASYGSDLDVFRQELGDSGAFSYTFYGPAPGGWQSDLNNHGFTLIACVPGGSCVCWNGHLVC